MKLRLVPRSIVLQLIVLVTLAALLFHACMSVAFFAARNARAPSLPPSAERIVDLVNAIDLLPVDRQALYVARFSGANPNMRARLLPPGTAMPVGASGDDWSRMLESRLPEGSHLSVRQNEQLWIGTPTGATIEVGRGRPFGPPRFGDFVFGTTLFVALSATLFLVWAIRNITMPLATFAAAADRFTLDERDELLNEGGPTEVRTASRALNLMRTRIRSMMADRTRMLAAIGHDLRTPITRLRLRAEYIEDAALRTSVVRDLERMDAMVHSALEFLRDTTDTKVMQSLDIASLLQSVCDDFTDMGSPVGFEGPDHLAITAHSDDLRRLFSNLVANAVSHGKNVTVGLKPPRDRTIEVDVTDDGPGMSDTEKTHALEPFWRGAPSRDDETGFGLGLSIVQAIAKAHGGSVALLDAPACGLLCRIRLPIEAGTRAGERAL